MFFHVFIFIYLRSATCHSYLFVIVCVICLSMDNAKSIIFMQENCIVFVVLL